MDPSSLVKRLVGEIALDGIYGMNSSRLWDICARTYDFPLTDKLKDAIWRWIAGNADVTVENDVLYASEDLQWTTLTGASRVDNPVGQLAFELLCLIAHSRENGVSTVEASHKTGQDLRSLFGRVQTLVNLGIVHKFPVIEGGASTNRMVFHAYSGSHSVSDAVVDKQAISAHISEYCKLGIHGIRTIRDVVKEVGSKLTRTKKTRRRPTVMVCLRDLEVMGCIRKVTMVHPEFPERHYPCIEYVRDFTIDGSAGASSAGSAGIGTGSQESKSVIIMDRRAISAPRSTAAEDDESEPAEDEDEEDDDTKSEVGGTSTSDLKFDAEKAVKSTNSSALVLANTTYPLINQIFDFVQAQGNAGISAMELTRSLTGNSYGKALGKYLDGLTAPVSENTKLSQIEHLSLVKGVDFNRRVKFYRYFTKIAYNKIENPPAEWGEFLPDHAIEPSMSLARLSRSTARPLPGVCSIVRDSARKLRPLFHGDKEVRGSEVVLRSGPTEDATTTANGVAKRKRGRPRKNEKRELQVKEDLPPPPIKVEPVPVSLESLGGVPISQREWRGGKPISGGRGATSRYLQYLPPQKEKGAIDATVASSVSGSATNITAPAAPAARASTSAPKISMSSSVGSLAHQNRAETLLHIVEKNHGVCVGGSPLLEKFNQAVSGQYAIDRRTIHSVVDRLARDGKLVKIYVNVPTVSGKQIMKYIIYDPTKITDPDHDPAIMKAKTEVIEGSREKHMLATKAAIDAVKVSVSALPRREMNDEQLRLYGPKKVLRSTDRILNTRSNKENTAKQKEKTKFGPSASEVLGVDKSGTLRSRGKRQKSTTEVRATSASDQDATTGTAVSVNNGASVASSAAPSAPTKRRTRRTGLDLERLVRSAIIYRSLFGSRSATNIDWKVIAACLGPEVSATEVRKHWNEARVFMANKENDTRNSGGDIVLKKTDQFETLFYDAYKHGLVEFNADDDPVTVIPKYTDWWARSEAEHLADDLGEDATHEEQQSKESQVLHKLNNLKLRERAVDYSVFDPLASLQSQVSIVNAEKLLFSTTFVTSEEKFKHTPRLTDHEMRLRAVIAADQGPTYSPQQAARELHGLTNGDTEFAKAGLELKKVIQWGESDPEKVPAGRPYVLSEQVLNTLNASRLDDTVPGKLAENLLYFTNSDMSTKVPPTIDEAEVMCVIDLCACGFGGKQGKLKRVGERFGLLSTDYKSRGIDKSEFESELTCNTYTTDDMLEGDTDPHPVAPPKSPNPLRPCIWDTKYLSSQSIWFKVAFRILSLVHFRPGITVNALALSLRAALEFEETETAVKTLSEAGALVRMSYGGYRAASDWVRYLV